MTKKKTPLPPSVGMRRRLGRLVQDVDDPIILPLPTAAVTRAAQKRRSYDVDDPENFTACALAECLGPLAGGEVLIMRRYAYVALEGETYTRRFVMDTRTCDVVKSNDLNRFEAIPANVTVSLLPATPGRRLATQGGPRVTKKSRGILANPPRPNPDPYRGVIRNGVHANG